MKIQHNYSNLSLRHDFQNQHVPPLIEIFLETEQKDIGSTTYFQFRDKVQHEILRTKPFF
jgi:hypothetical protein